MNKETLKLIITQLTKFLKGEIISFSKNLHKNKTAFHYYTEIIRYWNKLNFILSYTLSALNQSKKLIPQEKSIFLFIIYRYYYENASLKHIFDDLNLLFKQQKTILNKKSVNEFYNKIQTFSWKKALHNKSKFEKISIDKAIPSFFLRKLDPYMQKDFMIENIKQMNNPEESDLGIFVVEQSIKSQNNLTNEIKSFLSLNKIPAVEDSQIESLLLIPPKYISTILESKFYQKGNLLILDKGSAYIANLLLNGENTKILDMCAAPGIKSILLSKFINDNNRLLAVDFLLPRTLEMHNLLQFYNISTISTINTDSIDFPLRQGMYFDTILLDAPCTGSGTFSSNPELKWRQNRSFLYQNIILQEKLLNSAINMLKTNGILVYSTCSLYAEEGELQIQKVLDRLTPIKLPEFFSPSYKIDKTKIDGTGRLFPAIQKTKGFFVGKFKKKE